MEPPVKKQKAAGEDTFLAFLSERKEVKESPMGSPALKGIPVSERVNSVKEHVWDENSFEGPEKLLEMWFAPLDSSDPDAQKGLRKVSRPQWEEMLKLVKCTVLSVISNEHCDAYLLSESSFFVYPHKIVLKTCGTTTLLHSVERLLHIAAKECNLCVLDDVFYSRKNFFFPDRQLHPHHSFEDECKYLDSYFDGSAYVVGKINRDHWYLYMTDKDVTHASPVLRNPQPLPAGAKLLGVEGRPSIDATLEVIMTKLDAAKMQQFFNVDGDKTSKQVTKDSGIEDLMPGSVIDDFLFSPMGYSCNGLVDSSYWTIHITPQDHCSYVSFETNSVMDSYTDLIAKVVRTFKPSSFTVTLFLGHVESSAFQQKVHETFQDRIDGARRSTKTVYEFENNYKLAFAHYDMQP